MRGAFDFDCYFAGYFVAMKLFCFDLLKDDWDFCYETGFWLFLVAFVVVYSYIGFNYCDYGFLVNFILGCER